jgi:large subunit ribosomal protein L19
MLLPIRALGPRRFLRRRSRGAYVSAKKRALTKDIPAEKLNPPPTVSWKVMMKQVEEEERLRRCAKWFVPKDVRTGQLVKIKQSVGDWDSKEKEDEVEVLGLVIAKRNRGLNSSFMIRGVFETNEIEQQFPLYSPWIRGYEVVEYKKPKQSKIYWIRGKMQLVPRGPEIIEENRNTEKEFLVEKLSAK